jgi:rhodanese-related sulfurtransferase
MLRDLKLAVVILLASSVVAVATNAARTRGHVPWVASEPPKTTPPGPEKVGSEGDAKPPQPEEPFDPARHVNIDQVFEHVAAGTARFVDARKPEEFALGHIRGAMNVPSESVYASVETVQQFIGTGELVIVYCGGGHCEASHTVADVLRQFGYDNVRIYRNGWEELMKSGRLSEVIEEGAAP